MGKEKRPNIVKEKSFGFAVKIVNLNKQLVRQNKEYVISKQLLKSGTSIGANVEEADGGISKADFSNKISIAYKEAKESHYWLRLLHQTNFIEREQFEELIHDCDELCKLLFSILKTARIKKQNEY
ncbi:MAG: four helix bundle protein [Flavobacteriales bacterium]|nr:MAG: four helix bundle protein [Flavobacteriales bacterium]